MEESRQGKLDSHLAGRPCILSGTYDISIKTVPSFSSYVPCPDYERAERSGVPDEDLCERKLCESKEVFPIALKLEKIGAT